MHCSLRSSGIKLNFLRAGLFRPFNTLFSTLSVLCVRNPPFIVSGAKGDGKSLKEGMKHCRNTHVTKPVAAQRGCQICCFSNAKFSFVIINASTDFGYAC
jgi:hypothetical protein